MLLASADGAVKEPPPDLLAMAGRFVHAFRKPTKLEFIPFQDIREDLLEKEAKSVSRWGAGRGRSACRATLSCPRLQAPAGNSVSQWLNRMACIDG